MPICPKCGYVLEPKEAKCPRCVSLARRPQPQPPVEDEEEDAGRRAEPARPRAPVALIGAATFAGLAVILAIVMWLNARPRTRELPAPARMAAPAAGAPRSARGASTAAQPTPAPQAPATISPARIAQPAASPGPVASGLPEVPRLPARQAPVASPSPATAAAPGVQPGSPSPGADTLQGSPFDLRVGAELRVKPGIKPSALSVNGLTVNGSNGSISGSVVSGRFALRGVEGKPLQVVVEQRGDIARGGVSLRLTWVDQPFEVLAAGQLLGRFGDTAEYWQAQQ